MTTFNLADLWETLVRRGPGCRVSRRAGRSATRADRSTRPRTGSHTSCARAASRRATTSASTRATGPSTSRRCSGAGSAARSRSTSTGATSPAELRYVDRRRRARRDDRRGRVPARSSTSSGSTNAHRDRRVGRRSRRRARSTTCRGPRDDVYMLYTGGTTGMPKGVMWRHEDFFYACCLGGSPLDPIAEPEEIARNAMPAFRMDALVLGPLMHGGGQWLTLIALYGGSKPIVYCERSFDADEGARPRGARARDDDRHHRRRDGAAARRSRARATPTAGTCRRSSTLGNGGAMLSGAVKAQLHAAFPNAVLNDSYGASETGASGQRGRREHHERPARVRDRRPHLGARSRHARAARARFGQGRAVRARAATSRSGTGRTRRRPRRRSAPTRDGVRWVVPGDCATIDDDGRIVLFGRGSGCINTGGEKVFPEEVEAAIRAHRRRVRRGRRRRARRPLRPEGRRARAAARRRAGARRSTRCRSTAAR